LTSGGTAILQGGFAVMPTEKIQYLPFVHLPLEWAQESGYTPQMVFRHICEWTVAGAFPKGALVTAMGSEVSPLQIFEDFLSFSNGGWFTVGGWTRHGDPYEALERLKSVLVTKEGVISFCDKANTRPPPSLLGGYKRWWALSKGDKHLAPPPCPDALEHAKKLSATDHARGMMNTLRGTLNGLQGKPTDLVHAAAEMSRSISNFGMRSGSRVETALRPK
jgi:hypothetical protein